jgi:regulator of nucleoside diphosphate kinase
MNTMLRGVIKEDAWPDSGAVRILTLTYPHAAREAEGCVSVLSPLGVQLLGAREGDVVTWPEPEGRATKMVIDEVIFQPEASGDWHL